MDANAILDKLDELGVSAELRGPDIVFKPMGKVPVDLIDDIRASKPQIIALLHGKTFRLQFPKGTDPKIEYQEIVRKVEEEGVVLIWSRVLKDFIGIYDRESDRSKVPAGFVPYSDKELRALYVDTISPGVLKRVHEAKRSGVKITGTFKEDAGSLEDLLDNLRKGSRWLAKQHVKLWDDPDSVDLDKYTAALDKWDSLEATLRLAHTYTACIFGEGKRCPEDAQPACQACANSNSEANNQQEGVGDGNGT